MFVQHMLAVLAAGRHGRRPSCRTACCSAAAPSATSARGCSTTTSSRRSSASAPNLFYGTGIPACILVLRATGRQAAGAARARCCSSTPTREFTAGRAQNYLLPEHVEKIVSAYRRVRRHPRLRHRRHPRRSWPRTTTTSTSAATPTTRRRPSRRTSARTCTAASQGARSTPRQPCSPRTA